MRAVVLCVVAAAAFTTQACASAYSDFNQGISARNSHDAADTLRWMSAALSEAGLPAHLRPVALLDRGEAYVETKQNDLALSDFTACINLGNDNYPALMARGDLYVERGELDLARADYASAIRVRPELPRPYAASAATYMRQRKFDDALKNYSDGLTVNPWLLRFYALRSEAYRASGRYEEAIKEDNYAISRDDKYFDAYLARARAHDDAGDLKAALNDYGKAKEIDSKDDDVLLFEGIAQWKLGQFEDAARSFRRGAETSGYFFIWNYLANGKRHREMRDLTEIAAKVKSADWPAPIVALIAGTSQLDAVFAAAENGDQYVRGAQICEADFYAGEWKLVQGDAIAAKQYLNDATKNCEMGSIELGAAKTELGRLP